ncbi:MAG: DUF86 domain-containing protein [Candidatus Omnitrophota bacterium]
MKERDYTDYIRDILISTRDTKEFTKGITFDEFKQDKKTINAVLRSIEVMGEAVKNIPTQLKEKHPNVPWKKISGMRDKLIHEYLGVDLEVVWETVKNDLPSLEPLILDILKKLNNWQ